MQLDAQDFLSWIYKHAYGLQRNKIKKKEIRANLPAPATTIFIFGKSIMALPCALTAPKSPAIATPAVP